MLKKLTGQIPTVVIAAATAAIFGGTGAYAAAQITSAQIKDQTIQSRDIAAEGVGTSEVRNQSIVSGDIAEGGVGQSEIRNGSVYHGELSSSLWKMIKDSDTDNKAQDETIDGLDSRLKAEEAEGDTTGFEGAVYRVQVYKNGGAGDATVACADTEAESLKYTAISGGVRGGDAEAGFGKDNKFAVAASFPGRMNWETGLPKPDRLDGWIVLGSGEHTDTLEVWALCVPNTSIPIQTNVLDN